jgi:co-chaperonin GroES (HSP10)
MIKALGFRVLVDKDEPETTTAGGIVLAIDEKLEKHKVNTGTVLSIGPNAFKAYGKDYSGAPWCSVGDKVIFSRYAGVIVVDPDTAKEYTLLNDDDIAAAVVREGNYNV